MNIYIMLSMIVMAGAGVALQSVINSDLALRLGGMAIFASLISFVVGAVFLLVLGTLSGQINAQSFGLLFKQPLWAYSGGFLGAYLVFCTVVFAPKIGITNLVLMIIFGQIAMALLIDQFGLLSIDSRPIERHKIIGLIVIAFGLYLFYQ